MPFSTLSDAEWAQIIVIMETKFGNDAFERKFKGLKITSRQEYAFK